MYRCFPYIKGNNKFSRKTYHCVFIRYNDLHKGYRCYQGFTYPDMLCLMKTHYLMCLQSNIKLTLMSHLTLLLLLNLSLNCRHPIIMIKGKYRLLARPLLVIMLLHLMYSLMIRVLLTSQAQYQMLKNRLNLIIHTLTLKLQLQILNMPAAVRNNFLLKVQPMIIIKQPL